MDRIIPAESLFEKSVFVAIHRDGRCAVANALTALQKPLRPVCCCRSGPVAGRRQRSPYDRGPRPGYSRSRRFLPAARHCKPILRQNHTFRRYT